MSNLQRDIGSEDMKITELVTQLKQDKFLIPTFQREFVWDTDNILKLWDSIYRFYPIGSILYWETDSYLHTHRQLGGFQFPHDEDTVREFEEWKYILDGQQRSTSLLVSLQGGTGRVEGKEAFDYTVYFDAKRGDFFFADELEDRKDDVPAEFLVRLRDVPEWEFTFYKEISSVESFDEEVEHNLEQLKRIFTDYTVSVIRIKGVEVNEVCDIFERINQEGKKLHPVDIIVARTYRSEDQEDDKPGFYLRDNLTDLKSILLEQGGQYQDMDDLNIIQMVALCLRKEHSGGRNPFGITPKPLQNLETDHLEQNWDHCQDTVLDTIKFLVDMKILGPGMLPYAYLALPICYHLHQNSQPNRDLARQWFWRNAFGLENFRSSTDVYNFCEDFFDAVENGDDVTIPPLVISKTELVQASYNYRSALSRAVLAFLANQNPLDFTDPGAVVLDDVYLRLSQAPQLHHIYPRKFLGNVEDLPDEADMDSLMNICFLRAKTNIQVGGDNPLRYFKDFEDVRNFGRILESHLIPSEYIERNEFKPADYQEFLFARAEWFGKKLSKALPDVQVNLVE